jgi:hypothetical protein
MAVSNASRAPRHADFTVSTRKKAGQGREQTLVRFPGTTAVASGAELPKRSLVTRIGEPRRVARAFVEAAACGLALMYQVRIA